MLRSAISPNIVSWLWLSISAAGLAVIGNFVALSTPKIYASLTPAFLPQAYAQDIANLAVVAPAWLILAVLAWRGSVRAYLLWLGVLAFTVYNYVIYTFSIPFGPLFLLWVAVFGLSLYALIGGVTSVDNEAMKTAYTSRRAVKVVAWILIVVGLLFGLLWLSEDIPALLSGTTPQSLIDLGVPANPVHILDLGFFLPGAITTGVLLLKKRPLAYTLAPSFLVFLLLTGIPILLTPVIQANLGEPADWSILVPIGSLILVLLVLLAWLLTTIRPKNVL